MGNTVVIVNCVVTIVLILAFFTNIFDRKK